MSRSVETTLEEARRCPKCQQPGELARQTPAPRRLGVTPGARMHHYQCKNTRCKWYDDIVRIVQVNPDGSIPMPGRRDKAFPAIPDRTVEVNTALENQLQRELEGGTEVRR
jgi:hypothetical protein